MLLTARWLADENRSPLFALLVVGFVPTLVMGRVAMSDVPSLALVVLGLWLFWRGIERGWLYWLASGFVAGSSLLLRNANVLPFVPLYAGSVLRREKKCWALVVGGVAGVGVRLLTSYFFYGDPLFERVTYPFAPDTIGERLPLYLLGLLVLVPGGLVLALAYRGRRWPELRAAIVLFVVFYLFQGFSSIGTSPPKRVVLGLRYFIPLLPVLAFAMAEATPRLWRRLLAGRAREHRARLEALASTALVLGIAGVASASVIVHWGMDDWSASQAELRDEIERHAGYGTVVITNLFATAKFVEPLPSPYLPVRRAAISAKHVDYLAERHEREAIILLDRSDSQYWRNDARENEAFVRSLRRPLVLEVDRRVTATDRLRIWRVAVDRAVQR